MFFLATMQLISRKKQTLLTLLGIVLGTAAYIAISGMMMGFQTFMIDQLVNNDSHVRVSAREESLNSDSLNSILFEEHQFVHWIKPPSGRKDNAYILSPGNWFDRLEKDERVKALSQQVVVQGLASYGKVSVGVSIVGSIPERQKGVSNIEKYMLEGAFTDIGSGGNRIAVGDALLAKLGATRGEVVQLSSGKGEPQPFKIVSVFHLGSKIVDESKIFASLSDIQKLNKTPSRITDIAIRLKDLDTAAEFASTYNAMSTEKVQSWDQSNEGILSVFKTQDIVRNSMTISILIVAGFGIFNILSLAVSHKRREIAILRSIGFEPGDIIRLFFTQGAILGILGGLIGVILGFLTCVLMSKIETSANRSFGGGYMIISFDKMIYIKGLILALISSCFAGYFPAKSAGKLEPIEIIRGESL